jgi:hypothetical protein
MSELSSSESLHVVKTVERKNNLISIVIPKDSKLGSVFFYIAFSREKL